LGWSETAAKAGDLGEPGFEVAEEFLVAARLLGGGERMQPAPLRPGDGQHLGGGVELHRARAERDHRVAERKILRLEALQVAQHLVFAVVRIEDRGGQESRRARVRRGELGELQADGGELEFERRQLGVERGGIAEEREQLVDVGERGGFVEREADGVGVDAAEIDLLRGGGGVDALGGDVADGERVENRLGVDLGPERGEPLGEQLGEQPHALGDAAQALRAVVHRVHRGHHREEHLGGADVGRGFLAADVLLARAEGEAEGRVALRVLGHADEAAGHLAFAGVARGEEAGVRAAEAERHAEALRGAHGDVGAEFARRAQQREREQIGGDDAARAGGVDAGEEIGEVADVAPGVGILHEHADEAGGRLVGAMVAHHDLEPERLGAGLDDVDRLRVAGGGDEERVSRALMHAGAEHHGLGGGGALVEHRGVGDLEAGEIADHRLEIEQRFEAALGNLGLVGRVGGVPAGIFEDVALDDGGRERVVVTQADVSCGKSCSRRPACAARRARRFRPRRREGLAGRAGWSQARPHRPAPRAKAGRGAGASHPWRPHRSPDGGAQKYQAGQAGREEKT
jgi:hypothetical protein